MDIDWSKIIFSEPFFKRLDAIARRKVADHSTAEEAVNHVIRTLSKDKWQRCSQYTGACAPETYLHTLATRLIIDFNRSKEGRPRPPKWLSAKGDTWIHIWEQLCLDRNDREWVIQTNTLADVKDRQKINTIIDLIQAKLPWCGLSTRPASIDDEEFDSQDGPVTEAVDVHEAIDAEQAMLFVHCILLDADQPDPLADETPKAIIRAAKAVKISPDEKVLLKMHFCDGLNYAAIAKLLDIPKHQPVRLINKVLERAKAQLHEILQNPTKPKD